MLKRYNGVIILAASVLFLVGLAIYISVAPEKYQHASIEAVDNHHESDCDENRFHLSDQAQLNIGLETIRVEIKDYWKSVNIPAMIVPRPGQTYTNVPSPVAGVVMSIFPYEGEAVASGQPLFDLSLTHEGLIDTQSDYLLTLRSLEILRQEIARLEKVEDTVAGKELLNLRYQVQQHGGKLSILQDMLILHGLTLEQVKKIAISGKILRYITVLAPLELLQISSLKVELGEQVSVGQTLCILADYTELYVEGKAFEEDAAMLNDVLDADTRVTMVAHDDRMVEGLKLLYVASEIDIDSRILRFYVKLPNAKVFDQYRSGHRFIDWMYRPGQRVRLRVPVEQWGDCIVLPSAAIIKEGAQRFIFISEGGGNFYRKEVTVLHRNQFDAVIEQDGSVCQTEKIVVSGAYQIHLAMKNQNRETLPHAGHDH